MPSSQLSLIDSIDDDEHVDTEQQPNREIKCPVHGYIPVSKFITSLIDTPQFQRLRYLKQLGTSYYVWPGASHNRFEHSLGVFHLASLMVNRLRKAQPELGISDRDVKCVEAAGLCHDLGHGPFSHVFDGKFIPTALPGSKWQHEDASEMMLDYLVQDNNITLTPDEVAFIKDLISGKKNHTRVLGREEKDFLFEIVANKRNGIDVDKFDYIARDSQAVSSGTTTDLLRLVNSARVIDGEICYSEKNATTVYGLFQERFKLHKTIYQHKTAKSIEHMIVDALIKADPYLKIAERIHDARKFMHLTDDILNEIERSEGPDLEESRQIIRRIRTRDLYRLIDKAYLPWDDHAYWRDEFTSARIVETAKNLDAPELRTPKMRKLVAGLTEEHVIVDMATLHHGMGDKFPLDKCMFYGKYNPNEAFPPRRGEDISHLLPKEFGEVLSRVYTRDCRYFGVIQTAARALQETTAPLPHLALTELARTDEAPSTPRATTASMSSLLSDPAPPPKATPGRSTSMTSIATPSHNPYMTVSVDFTPKPKSQGGTMRRTRARKREEDIEEETPAAVAQADGSPARKKKKAAA